MLLLVTFFCGISWVLSERQGTNPLLEAHESLHQTFLGHSAKLLGIPRQVTTYTERTSNEMMDILTTEIESWPTYLRITEDIGEGLRACTQNATQQMNIKHAGIHLNLAYVNDEVQDYQFVVMRELRTFNILDDYDHFTAHVERIRQEKINRLNYGTFPPLEDMITDLIHSFFSISQDFQACVAMVVQSVGT